MLNTLDLILERYGEVGLYAAAHKCIFFETSTTWCGKVYSQREFNQDPERLAGLATIRRPETAGILQAVNRLHTSLPRMEEVV